MNPITRIASYCINFCLLTSVQNAYSQDTIATIQYKPLVFNSIETFATNYQFNHVYHNPDKADYKFAKKHQSLINQEPSKKNYQQYYNLARALWDLSQVEDATKMFLKIINSKEDFYSSSYYHSSDIPGDTTANIYGYGSFTSNYKNYAAIYLTKIYLEQKKYTEALQYLEDAVKRYPVSYNCGTGFNMMQDEYNFLYTSCYSGLGKNQEIFDLLLPNCLYGANDMLVNAVKKLYSPKQILEYLTLAEMSIVCSLDTFPSYAYTTSYGKKRKERTTDTIEYYSGRATVMLFGKAITMSSGVLQNGEHATKEQFIKEFTDSYFYTKLKEDI